MKTLMYSLVAAALLVVFATPSTAQRPGRQNRQRAGANAGAQQGSPAERLMQYDTDNDGALTLEELGDRRIKRIVSAADADADGKATLAELNQYFEEQANTIQTRGRGPGNMGPGNMGPGNMGPGNMGPGGPNQANGPQGQGPGGLQFGGPGGPQGGPGGFGPPAMGRPGQVLPEFMVQSLQLTDEQKAALAELQKYVDAELAKILTEDQASRLEAMAQPRERGGFGPPGAGGPGFGGPGAGPPGFGPPQGGAGNFQRRQGRQ